MKLLILIYSFLLISIVNAQTAKPTQALCLKVPGAVAVVMNSDGSCNSYTGSELSKRPAYAMSDSDKGIVNVEPPSLEFRVKALEDKMK